METITVTARRREEDPQEVPIPITTVNGKVLDQLNLYDVTDLQQLLPSTTIQQIANRSTSFSIRGLGNNAVNEGLETSVALYLDNVYLGRPGMVVFPMIDLEQVDELRGPQGTLFGKNSTAGLISFATRKPVFRDFTTVSYSGGSRNYMIAQGVANQVVSEASALRLTAYATGDNGWLQNLNGGRTLDGNNNQGFRGQLMVVPSAAFNLRIIADYNQQDSTYGTPVPYGNTGPGSQYYSRATAAGATNLITNPANYQVNVNSQQQMKIRQGGISAEANWHADTGHTITSISAARTWSSHPKTDPDLSNQSLIYDQGYNVDNRQLSQELRIASPKNNTIDYVGGLFLFTQTINNNLFINTGPNYTQFYLGTNAAPYTNSFSNVNSQSYGTGTTNSYALFGQSVWHVTPAFDLIAGLRGTFEQKWASTYRTAPVGGTGLTSQPAVAGPWNSGVMTTNNFAPTTLLSGSYQMTPNAMTYISYSYAEKSGGFNLNGVSSGPTLGSSSLSLNPERANDFELGIKSAWFDKKVITNINLYLTQVNGYQTASAQVPAGTSSPTWILINAGGVRSQGVEIDMQARPINRLNLRFNGSYNDAYYTSFQNGVCGAEMTASAAGTCDLTGQPINGAPRWIANTGGEYKWPVMDRLEQYVSGNYAWRSWTYGDVSNSQYSVIPSYGLLDLALGIRTPTGKQRWDASIWVKNATNNHYWLMTYQQTIMNSNNPYVGAAGMPRTIGGTLRIDFD
jgi:iron complex outermembrane receptor protein